METILVALRAISQMLTVTFVILSVILLVLMEYHPILMKLKKGLGRFGTVCRN